MTFVQPPLFNLQPSSPSKGGRLDGLDMFGGFGGVTAGAEAAGIPIDLAVNHWLPAITVHARNFPGADHHQADLVDTASTRYSDPADLPPADVLFAAPSCRYHSKARGKRFLKEGPTEYNYVPPQLSSDKNAMSELSRATAFCPLRYASRHLPKLVMLECTVELCQWGPPIKPGSSTGDGSMFKWYMKLWRELGYDYEIKFFNSMFFGAPQSRDRVYIVMWRKGSTAVDLDYRPEAFCMSDTCSGTWRRSTQWFKKPSKVWPLPRYGKYGARNQYLYRCETCNEPVEPARPPAYSVIDFDNLGRKLTDLDLAPKTLDRIARGILKFEMMPAIEVAGGKFKGIVTPVAGNTYEHPGCSRSRSLIDPLFAQTATPEHAVVTQEVDETSVVDGAFITEMRGGGSVEAGQKHVTHPLHTVTAGGNHHGFVSWTKVNGGPTSTSWHDLMGPLGAITARDTTALLSMETAGERATFEALARIERARTNLVRGKVDAAGVLDRVGRDNIRFRMLNTRTERRRAMTFPDGFDTNDVTDQDAARGFGNAVTPCVSRYIASQMVAAL